MTKTKDTAAPAHGTDAPRASESDARGKGNGSRGGKPSSGRGEYQKTVLVNETAETPAVSTNSYFGNRGSSTGSGTPPRLNLSSSSLAALSQRYDILSEAGHGAMGNVYKARDRETGETVALKLIKPEIASDHAMTERFKNELLFARKITHKNVCRVYEFNRIGGIAYTSMEFVEGESLRSVLSRFGGLPVRKGVDIALQICSGLKEAHAQGIVHRDLKPENVMIDAHGNVKIMDFGIARSMEGGTRLTGAMIGTPAYMAPEQVSGKPVDYRTDIYALGLVLYEMFTGSETFRADTPVAVAVKQMQEAPTPPHDLEPSIPVYLERAILKCLEKEPAKRFQSITELENALRSARTTGGAAAPLPVAGRGTMRGSAVTHTHPVPITKPQKPKSKRLRIALIAAGILLVLGILRAINLNRKASQIQLPDVAAAPGPPARTFAATDGGSAGAHSATAAPLKKTAPLEHSRSVAPTNANEKPSSPEVFPRLEWGNHTPQPWQARSPQQSFVWVGRYDREQRAQEMAKRLEDQNLPVTIQPRHTTQGQDFFVVFTGPYSSAEAQKVLQWLHDVGIDRARLVKGGQNQSWH